MPVALLLVDHGSRSETANRMLEDVAEMVRRQRPGLTVKVAHMDLASPSIPDGLKACAAAGATEIVVHPYMLSPGRHAVVDIPRMVEEAMRDMAGIEYRVTSPLGLHERLAEIVLERSAL